MIQPRLKKYEVEKMRTRAISIVQKGAATNSDAYLLQTAPALVPDGTENADGAVEYPIVALVQEHLGALEGDDVRDAAAAIIDVLEQGAVAEKLATYRAGYPSYQLWDVFCSAYFDASTDEEKAAIIADFADVLRGELILGDSDALTQWAAKVEHAAQPKGDAVTTETTQTPAGEAVTQEATTTPEASTENAPAVLTQSDVESLIQSALSPLADKLSTTETSLTDANAVIEQQKTEIAQLKSKTAPASRQPDAEPTGAVTQAQPETNPYANSGLHHYLTQHFPNTR